MPVLNKSRVLCHRQTASTTVVMIVAWRIDNIQEQLNFEEVSNNTFANVWLRAGVKFAGERCDN